MNFRIRPIALSDRPSWMELWRDYCVFYQVTLTPEVTERTWQRVNTQGSAMFALMAVDESETGIGLCNYILHPNTWSDRTICYLEDLYVAERARRLGVATRLIETLVEIGRRENWFRIYWHTKTGNARARAVYDRLAVHTDHARYEIAL
jgi:GNAT superfamily N-acetyltransferase